MKDKSDLAIFIVESLAETQGYQINYKIVEKHIDDFEKTTKTNVDIVDLNLEQ